MAALYARCEVAQRCYLRSCPAHSPETPSLPPAAPASVGRRDLRTGAGTCAVSNPSTTSGHLRGGKNQKRLHHCKSMVFGVANFRPMKLVTPITCIIVMIPGRSQYLTTPSRMLTAQQVLTDQQTSIGYTSRLKWISKTKMDAPVYTLHCKHNRRGVSTSNQLRPPLRPVASMCIF